MNAAFLRSPRRTGKVRTSVLDTESQSRARAGATLEQAERVDRSARGRYRSTGPRPRVSTAPTPSILETDLLAASLSRARTRLGTALARAANAFAKRRCWTFFGYARASDYARERLGRSGRWLLDLAALGDALDGMPALADAMNGDDGGRPLGRVAALLIGRQATPDSARDWIGIARSLGLRELREALARARSAGSSVPLEAEGGEGPDGAADQDTNLRESADIDSIGPTSEDSNEGRPGSPERASCGSGPGESASPPGSTNHGSEDVDDERVLVRICVPQAVSAAFEDALDLFRAVSGEEASVTAFVEALVAESFAGPSPPDAETVPLRSAPGTSVVERALARATQNWRLLPSGSEDLALIQPSVGTGAWAHLEASPEGETSRVVAAEDLHSDPGSGGTNDVETARAALEARSTLARFEDLIAVAGEGGAASLDAQLRAAVALEDEIERRLGALLAKLGERGAWSTLLFAGVGHYGEQRLGLCRTVAEDRAGLSRDLRRFPALREAYESGRIGVEAALLIRRLLGRRPSESTVESAWISHAREVTIRRLRDEIRIIGLGGADAVPIRRLRDEIRTIGLGEADAANDPPAPFHSRMPLSDADWHGSLYREPGTSLDRVARLGRSAADCMNPDVFLRLRLPSDLAPMFLSAIESRRVELAKAVDAVPWHEPWPDPAAPGSVMSARTFSIRCRRVPAWVGLLALVEDFVSTWDDARGSPRRAAGSVYSREGWRCAAPGCASRRNLEEHHVVYRSRGGNDDASNRLCLCRFHHQKGEHGGFALCRGSAPLGITWRLGWNGIGGAFKNDRAICPSASLLRGAGRR